MTPSPPAPRDVLQPRARFQSLGAKLAAWWATLALLAAASTSAAQSLKPSVFTPAQAGVSANGAWTRGAFMEIFVRAYKDSNGDGIGDLRGLIEQLDHLQDLGIKGLWLMPVTRSADRDHGYAVSDFRDIDPDYGTQEDMKALLREAHARGMGVIMDYVLNHASYEHPAFQAALKSTESAYRPWFLWSEERPQGWDIWGKHPWYHVGSAPWAFEGEPQRWPAPPAAARGFYFGTFGPHMPDFNWHHPAVKRFHEDNLRHWLNLGLDGFRLDAVPHLVEKDAVNWNDQAESRALTAHFQRLVRSVPGRYVVCEATANPTAYGRDEVCGSAFAFGLERAIIEAAQGQAQATPKVAAYFETAPLSMATMLSNHDIFAGRRLWDQFQGHEARYKLAAATYLLLPGTPFIYYGEEIGMAGVNDLPGDLPLRCPMSWTAEGGFTTGKPFRPKAPNAATHHVQAQRQDPGSLFQFYKAMLSLRNGQVSIRDGDYRHAFAQGHGLGFQRTTPEQRSLVLIHYGDQGTELKVPGLHAGLRLVPLLRQRLDPAHSPAPALPSNTWPLPDAGTGLAPMPPLSVAVYRIISADSP
jgi:alpha-amylase